MGRKNKIKQLIELNGGTPYRFYRGIYKAVECGPTIGMEIGGEWVYNADLPNDGDDFPNPTAISVSSIVEGSDAEVPPIVMRSDKFTSDAFYAAVDEVNQEACRLWDEANEEEWEEENVD